MIVETALRIAGPGAHLVARPAGVAHVYTGPLTASGRYVPRAGRTPCRAHHRRLAVIPPQRRSSLDPANRHPRLCARCAARLADIDPRPRRAALTTREQWRDAHQGLTRYDLAIALEFAQTAEEVDQVGYLVLVLFGHRGGAEPLPRRHAPPRSLNHLVGAARARFHRQAAERARLWSDLVASGTERRKAEAAQARADREARVARLGINNARPTKEPR